MQCPVASIAGKGTAACPRPPSKCPSLSPDPPSSCPFCPHSATIPTHSICLPGRSHVHPKPKYIQICLKQYDQNCPKLINSIFNQQPRSITHWLDKVNSSWTRRYSCPWTTCSSKPSWIWQHSWDLNHWLLLSERIQMLKVSRFNIFIVWSFLSLWYALPIFDSLLFAVFYK